MGKYIYGHIVWLKKGSFKGWNFKTGNTIFYLFDYLVLQS